MPCEEHATDQLAKFGDPSQTFLKKIAVFILSYVVFVIYI